MLRRLSLRDFVIVESLAVEMAAGFSVLTGETGAGKSILIDALQLALGGRGDASLVREGASRAEIDAEFDSPASIAGWLDEAGFEVGETLLLRRTIDAQGKSRAWINGSATPIAQLREAADHLVDIHGQHAWQSLTRAPAVRALLDAFAGVDSVALGARWSEWKKASQALGSAGARQDELQAERDRLGWQVAELERLAPGPSEWTDLEAEHKKLANAQSLIDAARAALDSIAGVDDNADARVERALGALRGVADYDDRLAATIEVLEGAQAQIKDAAHTIGSYLNHTEVDPHRLQALDDRLAAWLGAARRFRRPPAELPALLAECHDKLRALEAAADLHTLEGELVRARAAFEIEARRVAAARAAGAPKLAAAVTQAMQELGMAGGRFEVDLQSQPEPQSFGLESAEFLVAGHAGSTPRPIGKVASGGELSRIALAIAVTTSRLQGTGEAAETLIFDEIDAGVGGTVADAVGRLMKQLGRDRQVLAVTHLPQVAASADHHFVVSKRVRGGLAISELNNVSGELRVAEIARMLGGERRSSTSIAHAQELLAVGAENRPTPRTRKGA